ncbi:HlyD family secretion protein [Devosia naphthalenivorans]|uniref:HlyD family secretion protein n=1 Tax=Devosia naphthalenivorans TaxID=2082392 RepID=UPI000D34B64E|nr:HlyD family secretion protein [Devosia naphthalenivorans]
MAQVTAFVGNGENRFTGSRLNDEGAEQQARVTTLEQTSRQLQPAVQDEILGAEAAKPSAKRKKAKAFGLLLLAGLGACIAWYPLSDHHAPFAGGASIIADVTQISPRVPGPVTEVLITDNASVTAGQTLFQIDPTTYQMDVEQARAQLSQVLNSVGSGFAAIPAAAAKLEQAEVALDTANDDLDRARQLADKGLLAPAKLSQAEAAQRSAQLNVDAAAGEVERLTVAAGASDADNPNVRAARAALEKAEFALASTRIVAPADGYVSNLSLTQGQFIGAGTAALTFINPATQMVIADFRENQLINVQPGDQAIVTFEAAPGRQFQATVESVAWGISSGRTSVNGLSQSSNDTRWFPPARKIPVRVKLDDIGALPANVRLGSEAGVLIVPEDGLIPAIAKALLAMGGFTAGFN